MIPIKLELKNFLSYGSPIVTVDFSNHSLICLSGKNGNGKSALLDAITWALWGQARKVSGAIKADSGLIRLGQTQMMVSLEFICNNNRYRVRREHAITYGKPVISLSFELFDTSKKSFSSLSENTIKQTQEKIEKMIGIDFDTFINSAFLRQGQANEFSKKTPKERKQILTNILGLAQYDLLNKRALDKSRTYSDEQKVLIKLDEQNVIELSEENVVIEEHKKLSNDLNLLEQEMKNISLLIEEYEKKQVSFAHDKYKYDQLENEKNNIKSLYEQKKHNFLSLSKTWRDVHKKSLKFPNSEIIEKEHRKLLEQDKIMRNRHQEEMLLQERLITIKHKHQELLLSREKLALVYKQVEEQIATKESLCNEKKKKISDLEIKLNDIAKDLQKYDAFKETWEKTKNQFEKRRIFYQGLVQRGNYAQQELKELDRKKLVAQDEKSPSCPLCEQVLTLKRKQFLSKLFARQELFFTHRVSRISRLLKSLKILLLEQHGIAKKYELEDECYKQLKATEESCTKLLSDMKIEYEKEFLALELLRARKRKEGELLSSSQVTNTYDAEILEIEKKRKELDYNKKEHDSLHESLHTIEKQVQEFNLLKVAMQEQTANRREISTIWTELRLNKTRYNEITATQQKLSIINSDWERNQQLLSVEKARYQEISKRKESVINLQGQLEGKIKRFSLIKDEQAKRAKEIERLAELSKEYQILATLFGKDGIQALLIDDAIPEIEAEANTLLSKLTDNKAQIFIESLRDLKKGGVKESLDIHISDATGIRPYEMFSGGEAFRIDFALRIAVSKLLARRAGTALQTLIIDEGFGSQDEEGLQRLMDAIHAIQKDFVKIIVVSHLAGFKDNFPVHFIVEKNSLGSFVKVEERG